MTTTRHEFLAQLHALLKPKTYLETGVQYGHSLALAIHSEVAIGVDPQPLVAPIGNQVIHAMPSDSFFATRPDLRIDMAFIDGLHHEDQAYRDLMNICRHSHEDTVVVMDDVLPFTQAMAARVMCPGDWTGDVWKTAYWLWERRLGAFVDTFPTGTMVVFAKDFDELEPYVILKSDEVPASILNREMAMSAHDALTLVSLRMGHQVSS